MNPDEPAGDSQDGSAEEEPLIPDEIDEEFYTDLCGKIDELIKFTRIKLDNAQNADNIQRIQMVCEKYKSDLHQEELKTEELTNQLEDLKKNLENTLKTSELHQDTNKALKSVIERAWKQKDAAQAREEAAQEELYKLRDKVEHMEVVIQRMSDRKGPLDIVSKTVEVDNTKETYEKLKHEISEMNKKLQIQRLYTNEMEQMCKTFEDKNKGLLQILEDTSAESFKFKKNLDSNSKELAELKLNEEINIENLKKLKLQNEKYLKHHVQHSLQLLATKTNLDQLRTLHNSTNNKLTKAVNDVEYLNVEKEKLKMDLIQKTNFLKAKEDQYYKIKQEKSKLQRMHNDQTTKLAVAERTKEKTDTEVTRLRIQVSTLEKELIGEKATVEKCNRKIDSLTNDRDHVKLELIAAKLLVQKGEEKSDFLRQDIKALKNIIQDNILKEKKLYDDLNKSKHDTEKKLEEIQLLTVKIDFLEGELHLRDNLIAELNDNINELQLELTKTKGLLDTAINEKKSLQRNVQQLNKEKDSFTEKLQTAKTHSSELEEKIVQKNDETSKLQITIGRLEKERELAKIEMKNTQVSYQHTRSELLEKRMECDRYCISLQDDEQKICKIKKQLDNCIYDKNLIDSNLTKINNDLAQVKDRLQLTQNALDQCEKSYGSSLDNVRLLKIEIRNLRIERDILKRDRESSVDLRTELLQISRVLNQERIKARALQDEMLTPMNIHRWRNLGGQDPEKMDLINKIQHLQKQVLAQNVSVMEREKALEESHKMYTALKEFMVKLPSYKVKEQVTEMKHNLNVKQRKIKALTAELTSKEMDEKSKELTVEELRTNLTTAKKELTQEKKKKMKLLEERQIIAQMQMQMQCFSAPPIATRMFGAGFKMPGGSSVLG